MSGQWRCRNCRGAFCGPLDKQHQPDCPHCGSDDVFESHDETVLRGRAEPTDVLDHMIAGANHTPGVADQMLLCEVMTKVEKAIEHMRVFSPAHGHSMAEGHVRTALRYEREILQSMMDRNKHVGAAMRQIAGGG